MKARLLAHELLCWRMFVFIYGLFSRTFFHSKIYDSVQIPEKPKNQNLSGFVCRFINRWTLLTVRHYQWQS
ncbi:uncharacterized protein ARMOST_20522 [Armillaria ostoyae]|uniref:Uncharacterized protein n=1 Tax=Armillaria ostoyae TaxID=47428 RepID=A0A284S7K9_ARMOS|nr:uncharacterized protein ARMOST_20522 [Armillaria ostoyae]